MELAFEHFWIVSIIIMGINAFMLRWRSKEYVSENPKLKPGYKKLFRAFIIYGNIPWLIMGIGDITGIPGVTFFGLSSEPLVLLFHASWVVIAALTVRWIYFKNGADFLARHPGIFQKPGPWFSVSEDVSAREIKRLIPQALFTFIAIMALIYLNG